MASTQRRTPWWRKLALACCSTLLVYIPVEIAFRYHESRNIAHGKYQISVIGEPLNDANSPGFLAQNKTVKFRIFSENHELCEEHTIVTNNLGFVSANSYEAAKPPGEFRIAAVGDSFTSCDNNDFPWPDLLERRLNANQELKAQLGVASFRVLNFGLSGAGFPQMLYNYVRCVERFNPDAVLVNYIEDDFRREPDTNLVEHIAAAAAHRKRDESPDRPAPDPKMDTIEFGGVKIAVQGARLGIPPDLHDPHIVPSRLFIISDEALAFDQERIQGIKTEIAGILLRERLWQSCYPHALARLFGVRFSLDDRRVAVSKLSRSNSAAVEQAAACLKMIHGRHPKLLVLHNPVYWELVPPVKEAKRTKQLREKLPELAVLDMKQLLPVDQDESEIIRWYQLPYDAHWSNKGAELYATAIERVLQQKLVDLMNGSSETPKETSPLAVNPGTTR